MNEFLSVNKLFNGFYLVNKVTKINVLLISKNVLNIIHLGGQNKRFLKLLKKMCSSFLAFQFILYYKSFKILRSVGL